MCKIYDAIYELAKHVESNVLICSVGHLKIEGELHKCDCITNDCKCYDGIITLKDVIIKCHKSGEEMKYKWLNISSKHIQAFAFKCCEK